LTKKLEKLEKKKAQYDKRIRALEERLYNQLRLLKDQHAYIKILNSQVFSLFDVIKHGDETHQNWLRDKIESHFGIRVPSTTHTPYPQPDSQTPHLSPSQDNTGTTQESTSLEHQNLAEHIEQDPVQSTSPLV
jgi:hypothetical protein